MENMNRGESRTGQPHDNLKARKNKKQPPNGFEGMNYEQKRKPYNDGDGSERDWNGNSESDTNTGIRRDDR
jgi:hypothetical protein